uniref:Protein GAST1 n=1 Tax=Anthurium amnicola TaxID=1678845 RepID=A0A1D1XE09_9ARAE
MASSMGRSALAPLLLLLIFLFGEAASTEVMLQEEFGMSLATGSKHKHRHSGFAAAECPGACNYRCSKTAYKKPCLFFCQKCCFKCRCVPPGTYAHKEACPCYSNWKTKRGGPKCP